MAILVPKNTWSCAVQSEHNVTPWRDLERGCVDASHPRQSMDSKLLSPRPEIPNGHIPLTFLLGRRANEYSLPSLHQRAPWKSPHATGSSVLSGGAHVRQREQQARALLERVLAREVRLDTKNKADHDTALAPPQMRVSSADRRRRSVELQRVIDESEEEGVCGVVDRSGPSGGSMAGDLYQRREEFAQYHGYAPVERGFVEVVGQHERVKYTQSRRQLHEDDKRKRVKQLKTKQTRVEGLRRQLQQQQAETKQKLKQAELRLRGPALESSEEEEDEEDEHERRGLLLATSSSLGEQKARGKSDPEARERQQEDEEKAKATQRLELEERRHSVQRRRQERQSLRQQRRTMHEYDKSLLAKLAGPGPSFQSMLRIEDPSDTTSSIDETASCLSLPLEVLLASTCHDTEDNQRRNELAARLQERQHDVFARSRTRSLQFGGGFGSKPRPSRLEEEITMPNPREDGEILATHAASVGVVKSKREIVADWKATLSTKGHPR